MKGIYPPLVYVLLFSVGIFVSLSFYSFTSEFVSSRNLELEKVQAEKICSFLQNLEENEGEFELDIMDFKIQTNPLKIIGSSVYNCDINLDSSGSCSGECKIRILGNRIVFS